MFRKVFHAENPGAMVLLFWPIAEEDEGEIDMSEAASSAGRLTESAAAAAACITSCHFPG